MSITIDLSDDVSLVTGAGAGIGEQIARWLARAGSKVAVVDNRRDHAERVAQSIVDEGLEAVAIVADARQDAAIDAMVEKVTDHLGPLRIAVNNIGMMGAAGAGPLMELDGAAWREVLDQNLVLTALCARAEAKTLLAQGSGGVIINVSSGETTRPSPFLPHYAAAKAGINHLTQSLAVELGPHGIRVVAIAPGTTLTEQVRAAYSDEMVEAIVASHPLRVMTDPDELARLTVFLASDLARCITGQLILADAGAHLSWERPTSGSNTR